MMARAEAWVYVWGAPGEYTYVPIRYDPAG